MPEVTVRFLPDRVRTRVEQGTNLLRAALEAGILPRDLCGGNGVCKRCRMIVKEGRADDTSDAFPKGSGEVLACLTPVQEDLVVDIPAETLQGTGSRNDEIVWLEGFSPEVRESGRPICPLVRNLTVKAPSPTLEDIRSDHQRVGEAISGITGDEGVSWELHALRELPEAFRDGKNLCGTVGTDNQSERVLSFRQEESTCGRNDLLLAVDLGTTTLAAHLLEGVSGKTLGTATLFNSQASYGLEVTSRIMSGERIGFRSLQKVLVEDINELAGFLASKCERDVEDIQGIICAGNTAMIHFLLELSPSNLRRTPCSPVALRISPMPASEAGIRIGRTGMLYCLPGIGGWVGGDVTAGILTTGMQESEEVSMLVDLGTNGEVVVGNSQWLMACSASVGPAFEGGGIACGMKAVPGAIHRVTCTGEELKCEVLGGGNAQGICGSGIIDLVSAMLDAGIIDRSGKFSQSETARVETVNGEKRHWLVPEAPESTGVYITESDLEGVITAKAAVFAAIRILLKRLDLDFGKVSRFHIAGAFGNHLNIESAVAIGLVPDLPREKVLFAGNTSLLGAGRAILYKEDYRKLHVIAENATYMDLMGADDYVDEFRKALFLPHTDIEAFQNLN